MNEFGSRLGQIDPASLHFAALRSLGRIDSDVESEDGKVPFDWVPKDIPNRDRFRRHKLTRTDVQALVADRSAAIDVICWSILAWGGMHNSNRDHLWSVADRSWLDLAETVRSGSHDRQSAYRAFAELRSSKGNKLSGMRAAYFTKLIFFLMPRGADHSPPGYIMDQWAGCSVNLLADRQVVLMDCNARWHTTRNGPVLKWDHHVSDANDAARYEDYCMCIEAIGREVDMTPAVAERLLLTGKRNQKGSWRHYVVENCKPPETFGIAA